MASNADQTGLLHTPEHVKALAEQLRAEAAHAEARALRLQEGGEAASKQPCCSPILCASVGG